MLTVSYSKLWGLSTFLLVLYLTTISFAKPKTLDTVSLLKSKNVRSLSVFLNSITINNDILKSFVIPQNDNVSYANSLNFKKALIGISTKLKEDVDLKKNMPLKYLITSSFEAEQGLNEIFPINPEYFLDSYNMLYITDEAGLISVLNLNDPLILAQINFNDLIKELTSSFTEDDLTICLDNLQILSRINESPLTFSLDLSLNERYQLIQTLLDVLIEKYQKVKHYDPVYINPKLKFLKQNKEYITINLLKPKMQYNNFNFAKFNELYDNFRYNSYLQLKGKNDATTNLKSLSKIEFLTTYTSLKYPSTENTEKLKNLSRGNLILEELESQDKTQIFNGLLTDIDILTNLEFELSETSPYSVISAFDRIKAKIMLWYLTQPLYLVILRVLIISVITYVLAIITIRLTFFILDLVKKYTTVSKNLTAITANISEISKLINKVGINNIITVSVAILLSIVLCILWILINAGRGKKNDF